MKTPDQTEAWEDFPLDSKSLLEHLRAKFDDADVSAFVRAGKEREAFKLAAQIELIDELIEWSNSAAPASHAADSRKRSRSKPR